MASPLPRRLIFPPAELVCRWRRNLDINFCPGWDFNPRPANWQTSALTTRPPLEEQNWNTSMIRAFFVIVGGDLVLVWGRQKIFNFKGTSRNKNVSVSLCVLE